MEKEFRVLNVSELRVKFGKEDEKPIITGYAAVFNSLSEDLGAFREKIDPGAFKAAIGVSDTRALFNHDPNFVLGRQSNDTLRLSEDKKGLYMEVDPPNTQIIRDLVLSPIERGDIREQSFAFTVEADKWEGLDEKNSNELPVRTITRVAQLFDVSPVTYPAYPDTEVGVRSLEAAKEKMDAPPFVPLTIPEMLRNYAETWDIAEKNTEEKDALLEQLSSAILAEFTERFKSADVEPTQDEAKPEGEPTQAPLTGDPTKAEPEARERVAQLNERFKKYEVKR